MRVAVIGGGVGGGTAALRLRQHGADVTLYEAGAQLGGLVASFSVAGEPLERFYHHVFPHEDRIQALFAELGVAGDLEWLSSTVGVRRDGRIWPFTTALDVLRFRPLSLASRVRLGLGSQLRARAAHTDRLDDVPAMSWIERACGGAATEAIWRPLLRAKFGPAADSVPANWLLARFKQRAGARQSGKGEVLGYMRGGFKRFFDALEERLYAEGVDLRLTTPAERIEFDDGRVAGVRAAGASEEFDAVLFAGNLPGLGRLMDTDLAAAHEGLGVLCMVLELERPASPVYWLNVCDEDIPFGGVIEQTNLVDRDRYGGRSVVYLSRYFVHSEGVAARELKGELVDEWLDALRDVAPGFRDQEPIAVHPFRTGYAAPLVQLGYPRSMPPLVPSLPRGLALATTAQIYPEDRGMDNGVRLAERAVDELWRSLAEQHGRRARTRAARD